MWGDFCFFEQVHDFDELHCYQTLTQLVSRISVYGGGLANILTDQYDDVDQQMRGDLDSKWIVTANNVLSNTFTVLTLNQTSS